MSTELYAAIIAGVSALAGIFIGSNLNKKQKIREELFTHKVNAYAKLAQLIAEIRQDYVALLFDGTGSDVAPFEDFRSPIEIDEFFRKNLYINILFLSPNTKSNMDVFCDKIFECSKLTFNNSAMPDLFTRDMLLESFKKMIDECDDCIQKLYVEVGLNKFEKI